MNALQFKTILGYVICTVQGDQLLNFFRQCQRKHILLWDITLINDDKATVKLYATDQSKVKQLANDLHMKLSIKKRIGFIFILAKLWNQKEKIVAFLCAFILLIYLSQTVWYVKISGVPVHLENQIDKQLKQLGIKKGSFQLTSLPVEEVEKTIMDTLPQLLYISVKKRGTIYTIEAIEKKEEEEEYTNKPNDLIAIKSGVIEKMFIKEGQTVVQVNDFVQKGDTLVTGVINKSKSEQHTSDEDEETEKDITYVASEGEVYANTWYELTVTSTLKETYERLQGEKVDHYYVSIGNVQVPLFVWPRTKYNEKTIFYEHIPLQLFKQTLPFTLIKQTIYNKEMKNLTQSENEAKQKGIDHALIDLQNKLGKKAEIKKYYILHEVVDNGKVKLRLYVSVVENIAEIKPIHKDN